MAVSNHKFSGLILLFCYFQFDMNERLNKVHLLEGLELVSKKDDGLLMLRLRGSSHNIEAGLPLLRLRENTEAREKGIVEFDFLVKPVELIKKNHIEFSLDIVYNLKQLPSPLRAIKVNAASNADIILV